MIQACHFFINSMLLFKIAIIGMCYKDICDLIFIILPIFYFHINILNKQSFACFL